MGTSQGFLPLYISAIVGLSILCRCGRAISRISASSDLVARVLERNRTCWFARGDQQQEAIRCEGVRVVRTCSAMRVLM